MPNARVTFLCYSVIKCEHKGLFSITIWAIWACYNAWTIVLASWWQHTNTCFIVHINIHFAHQSIVHSTYNIHFVHQSLFHSTRNIPLHTRAYFIVHTTFILHIKANDILHTNIHFCTPKYTIHNIHIACPSVIWCTQHAGYECHINLLHKSQTESLVSTIVMHNAHLGLASGHTTFRCRFNNTKYGCHTVCCPKGGQEQGAKRRNNLNNKTRQRNARLKFHAIVYREVSFTAQHVLCCAKSNVINK